MAPRKDWMDRLLTLDGAVKERRNPHANVIQSPSPSLNFIFGNGWGLPRGYSVVYYGPPKSGKSLIGWLHAGQLHRDDPNAFVVKFNTEFREEGQLTAETAANMYGIDLKRYVGIDANDPSKVYDQIANKIDAWCSDGLPLGMIIIDSMNGIQGRRAMEQESMMTQNIGDVALTNKEGLKRVLEVQRKHQFALVMTSHVAVEMDPIEQKRGNKFKMGASIGVQHHAEYFVFVESNKNKAAQMNLLGQTFTDDTKKDMDDRAEKTGMKIRVIMKDSSMGPKGRYGEFTLDFKRGVINQHEEIFLLAKNRGLLQRPNNRTWVYGDRQWVGEETMIKALQQDTKLQEDLLKELRRQDAAGMFAQFDEQDQATWAANTKIDEITAA